MTQDLGGIQNKDEQNDGMRKVAVETPPMGPSTILFIIYTIISFGTYPFIWLCFRSKFINGIIGKEAISMNSVLILAVLFAGQQFVNASMEVAQEVSPGAFLFVSLIGLAVAIGFFCYIYFVITKPFVEALDQHLMTTSKIDLRPNKFWMFIFSYFYLNYTLNSLPGLQARANLMK